VTRLQADCTRLAAELAEAIKLTDLQQADLDRYKKAYEAARPNHPERAPREQLQLAFERVLEALGASPSANDEDADADAHHQPDEAGAASVDGKRGGGDGKRKRRHKHGRRRLDLTNLPVVEQRQEPEVVLASGGQGYRCIGEEISERVAFRPGEYVRYRLVRPKYVPIEMLAAAASAAEVELADDPGVEVQDELTDAEQERSRQEMDCVGTAQSQSRLGGSEILIAPLPENIWPNTMADPSAIAHVIVSKYGNLLPLNRQETISARAGFALPKSTQCGWLKAAHGFCTPVVDAMMADAKQHAFLIATDATSASVLPARRQGRAPPQVLPASERPSCDAWHVFVFIADRDHIVFRYNQEHNGRALQQMLDGYRGNLLADAASVFDVLYREHGMVEHGCWFHCRRPFYRALESDPQRSLEALSLIGKLFEIDRKLRAENLTLEEFTRLRAERAAPILKLFDDWIALHRGHVDPRGPLDSAIGYYLNQRDALHRFLADGRIRLDNNLCEQALRNLVVGLANWIFFANETGIAWYTTFRSLIASCALHRLNPDVYLEQLLRIVPHWPKHRVIELSPKFWLDTIAKLDARWRRILERPWEPGVVVSAEIAPTLVAGTARVVRAA
jgi:transposase